MAELVHSIRRSACSSRSWCGATGDGRYELIMGERRWRATQEAGLDTIPAIVRETGDDDLLRDALLENLHRSQLNPLEEAAAYQQLLDDFGCTHEELAARIGRSRPQISNTLRLLKLSPAVQRRVAAGVLSAGHARALLGVEDPEVQDRLAAPGGRRGHLGARPRGDRRGRRPAGRRRPRRRAARRARPRPALGDLADRLSDRLETRVKVDLGKRKGRITVEFASLPDLERIVGLIDPGTPPGATGRRGQRKFVDKAIDRQSDIVDQPLAATQLSEQLPSRRVRPARRSRSSPRSRSQRERRTRRCRRAGAAAGRQRGPPRCCGS